MGKTKNRYTAIIEEIFKKYYRRGMKEVPFKREEISKVAKKMKIDLPKNIGDILYSFRYRAELPESISSKAPQGHEWLLVPRGISKYAFVARKIIRIVPNDALAETKIPDATPGVISKYALNDEQATLAILRYNRLLDIFTGVTCYSLQNHLRTNVPGIGQIETDEIYVGIDKKGVHYIFPVQVKSKKDRIGVVQIEQDVAMCEHKFQQMVCIPIAAQFIAESKIAIFQFEIVKEEIKIAHEKHYRLVPPDDLTDEDLIVYRKRTQ